MSVLLPEPQPVAQDDLHSEPPAPWDQLGIVPGQVFRAFGMRRSGTHAIAGWLLRNIATQKSVYLNNCKPGSDPLTSFRSIEINSSRCKARAGQSDLPELTAGAGNGAFFLFTYEDTSPMEFTGPKTLSGPFDAALIDNDLIIYRGFLNWSASLLKKMQANIGYSLSRRVSVLMQGVDRYTRLLELVAQSEKPGNSVAICYDNWVQSATYRANILDRLNLPQRDNTLGPVQQYGDGSSFQKDEQTAGNLQTDRRWMQMAGDAEYQAILYLASRDGALMQQLSRLFPYDADRLTDITAQKPLFAGAVA